MSYVIHGILELITCCAVPPAFSSTIFLRKEAAQQLHEYHSPWDGSSRAAKSRVIRVYKNLLQIVGHFVYSGYEGPPISAGAHVNRLKGWTSGTQQKWIVLPVKSVTTGPSPSWSRSEDEQDRKDISNDAVVVCY